MSTNTSKTETKTKKYTQLVQTKKQTTKEWQINRNRNKILNKNEKNKTQTAEK